MSLLGTRNKCNSRTVLDDYVILGNNYFKISQYESSRTQATDACELDQGSLAIAHNDLEFKFLKALAGNREL